LRCKSFIYSRTAILGEVKKTREDVYVTIRIPRELANEIDQIINSSGLGYRTRAELVNEAIRLRIESLLRSMKLRTTLQKKEE